VTVPPIGTQESTGAGAEQAAPSKVKRPVVVEIPDRPDPVPVLPRRASRRARAAARRRKRTESARASSLSPPAPPPSPPPPPAAIPIGEPIPMPAPPGPGNDGQGSVVNEFVGLVEAGEFGGSGVVVREVAAPVEESEPSKPVVGRKVRRNRRRRRLVAGSMFVLVALGAGLAVVGWHRVRNSTAGTYVDAGLQPDEPGYVALVTPTPTMLLLQKDSDGDLVGVALLALRSQDEGGSVVLMPVRTQAPFADPGTTLAAVYGTGGAEAVRTQLELMLKVDLGDTVEVDDARWASLVGPIGSVSLVLPHAIDQWQNGQVDLPASDVGALLAAEDDEGELPRLDRQELFWDEWLPRVAAEGENAVPGETDVGLGRFVRGLAAGDTDVVAFPVAKVTPSYGELFEPTEDLADEVMATAVPYPQEPGIGRRVRIRLLNGTTTQGLAVLAAHPLVKAGGEIAVSGNAESFHEPKTRIIYATPRLRDKANSLRDALGVGVVEKESSAETQEPADDADRIDVTVVLGADAPAVIRRLESSG